MKGEKITKINYEFNNKGKDLEAIFTNMLRNFIKRDAITNFYNKNVI